MMTDTQQFLSDLLDTVQCTQQRLTLGMDAASSHSLKTTFKQQLQKFDQIESDIQFIAARRGWELSEPQPVMLLIRNFRSRWCIHHSRTDAAIGELMIRCSTDDMIGILKTANSMDLQDSQCQTILQKLLDCSWVIIRQMHPFL